MISKATPTRPAAASSPTWIDGLTDGLSGSEVGYLTAANGTYAETKIVHSGKQSMPMDYNNVKSPFYSEVTQ